MGCMVDFQKIPKCIVSLGRAKDRLLCMIGMDRGNARDHVVRALRILAPCIVPERLTPYRLLL